MTQMMRLHIMPLAFAAVLAACQPAEPELQVTDSPILLGDPIEIKISGLEPNAEIELYTEQRKKSRGKLYNYTSSAKMAADEKGEIDTASTPSIEGTYTGVSQAGLFWSQEYSDADQALSETPLIVHADLNGDDIPDLSQEIEIVDTLEGIRIQSISDDFLGGVIAYPPGEGPWPALIVLGGSEGGDRTAKRMAPRFASHGYVTLGLPYYSPAWGDQPQAVPGLPKAFADIPVDKLAEAKDYLQENPLVKPDRIGIWGVSKGAEYALLGGSYIDGFAAIAAIVPTDVVWEGWGAGETVSSFSWQGEPLPFVPYKGVQEEYAKENPEIRNFHDAGRAANPERVAPARIAVEKIDEPVFVVGGDKDIVWASGPMSRRIKERRDGAGLETVMFVSEDAGHYLSGTGYTRTSEAEAKLQTQAWPALLEFFETHLKDE